MNEFLAFKMTLVFAILCVNMIFWHIVRLKKPGILWVYYVKEVSNYLAALSAVSIFVILVISTINKLP